MFPREIWGEIFQYIDVSSYLALALVCRAFRRKLLILKNRLIQGWLVPFEDDKMIGTKLCGHIHGFCKKKKEKVHYWRQDIERNIYYEHGKIKYEYDYMLIEKLKSFTVVICNKNKKIISWHFGDYVYNGCTVSIGDFRNGHIWIYITQPDFELMVGRKIGDNLEEYCRYIYYKFKSFAFINFIKKLCELGILTQLHVNYMRYGAIITIDKNTLFHNYFNLTSNSINSRELARIIQNGKIIKYLRTFIKKVEYKPG